jgi:hypothetical protein
MKKMRKLVLAVCLSGCLPTGRHPPGEAPAEGGPAAPRFIQPPTPTREEAIIVEGYGAPGQRIELYVNSVLAGETVAASDGRFMFASARLSMGMNLITGVAIDEQGRRSAQGISGAGERAGTESVLKPEVRVERQ